MVAVKLMLLTFHLLFQPGLCPSGENDAVDQVNFHPQMAASLFVLCKGIFQNLCLYLYCCFFLQTACMDTIYKILKHYMAEIKDFNSSDLFRAVSIMMQVDIYI